MKKIKTVCCECGDLIHDGPTINGYASHGYCKKCVVMMMAVIERDYPHDSQNKA